MVNVYRLLGVRPVINAAGTLTRLSGTRMVPEASAAMREASAEFVRMDELQAEVGRRIADWTGTEAALVTCGAAASLTLAAAACLCRFDLGRMDRLPHNGGMPNEIIVPRSHRNGYDHALRAAGARLIETGLAERTRDPQPWELAAAVNEKTIAFAYFVGFSQLDLAGVVGVAREHGLPVIVDASASLPPRSNLTAFATAGADLVAYSGGKGIRGPQASGILCGRKDLITSAALQMLDMDYVSELWNPPPGLVDPDIVARGVPNHGIGRSMKVGKEEIAGLWGALDRFVHEDDAQDAGRMRELADRVVAGLEKLPGLDVKLRDDEPLWPRVEVRIPSGDGRPTALDLVRHLEEGEPRICVVQSKARQGILGIDPFGLEADEVDRIVTRFKELVAG